MGIEKIADRIRKLLALAGNNPSPEEAARAFERAQALAIKYALRLDDVAAEEVREERPMPTAEGMIKKTVYEAAKYVHWRGVVAMAVAEANLCGCYRSGGHMIFYGLPEHVELAAVMFNVVCDQIDALGRAAVRGSRAAEVGARRYGRSFRIGCGDTVRSRLKDALGRTLHEAEVAATESTALVRVEAARAYVKANTKALARKAVDLGLGSKRGRSAGVSREAYQAGRVAGHNVRLSGRTALGAAR